MRLNIPDEVPQPLLGEMGRFAALVVILSRYVGGSLEGLSSHTEWHWSMVSDRSSTHRRTERERRPGWCWDRSQNNCKMRGSVNRFGHNRSVGLQNYA